jgi:hypothetical protein
MSNTWEKLDEPTRAILDRYRGEGVVAVWAALVRALRGNANPALFLSQLLHLSSRLGDDEGRFYQSQRRLAQQTGLGAGAQRKAVRLLERLGVLETTRQGIPARLYYRLDLPRLVALLRQHGDADVVADHDRHQGTDHGLELDPDDGLQQVAQNGQRQATGHGPHHNQIIEENIQESERKISPSPPQDAKTPRKKPGRQSTPKHPLPEDFMLTPAMRTWAAEHAPGVDLDHETAKLVAWARAKGEWRSDWVETWHLWMLNAAKPGLQGQRRPPTPPERHAGISAWLDQKREQVGGAP